MKNNRDFFKQKFDWGGFFAGLIVFGIIFNGCYRIVVPKITVETTNEEIVVKRDHGMGGDKIHIPRLSKIHSSQYGLDDKSY